MTIDPKTIRVGDELTVRGITNAIGADGSGQPLISVQFTDAEVAIYPSDIATHTPKPRPLEVGMPIRMKHNRFLRGELLGVAAPRAWVRLKAGTEEGIVVSLSDLEPAE